MTNAMDCSYDNDEYLAFGEVFPMAMDMSTDMSIQEFRKPINEMLEYRLAWEVAEGLKYSATCIGGGWYETKTGERFPGDEIEHDKYFINGVQYEGTLELPKNGEKRKRDEESNDNKKFKLWELEIKTKKSVLEPKTFKATTKKLLPQDNYILCGEPEPIREIAQKKSVFSFGPFLLYVFLLCAFLFCIFRN